MCSDKDVYQTSRHSGIMRILKNLISSGVCCKQRTQKHRYKFFVWKVKAHLGYHINNYNTPLTRGSVLGFLSHSYIVTLIIDSTSYAIFHISIWFWNTAFVVGFGLLSALLSRKNISTKTMLQVQLHVSHTSSYFTNETKIDSISH